MHAKTQNLIKYFQDNSGVARFSAILKAGFHPDSLAALEKNGQVEKISRGLYRLTDYVSGAHPDLVMVSLLAPRGVVCLISALAFHEVTNEIPKYVEIAIPRQSHANKIKYPPVRVYRFVLQVWKAGIEEHRIDGHTIQVYSLAKTIADCFKFRNKIGANVAREALKAAITEKHTQPKEIMKYAKICRVDSIIKPILEAII
jgi:predicted transcriptional regulator of viral defense system